MNGRSEHFVNEVSKSIPSQIPSVLVIQLDHGPTNFKYCRFFENKFHNYTHDLFIFTKTMIVETLDLTGSVAASLN